MLPNSAWTLSSQSAASVLLLPKHCLFNPLPCNPQQITVLWSPDDGLSDMTSRVVHGHCAARGCFCFLNCYCQLTLTHRWLTQIPDGKKKKVLASGDRTKGVNVAWTAALLNWTFNSDKSKLKLHVSCFRWFKMFIFIDSQSVKGRILEKPRCVEHILVDFRAYSGSEQQYFLPEVHKTVRGVSLCHIMETSNWFMQREPFSVWCLLAEVGVTNSTCSTLGNGAWVKLELQTLVLEYKSNAEVLKTADPRASTCGWLLDTRNHINCILTSRVVI